jgi:hypothetical protein
MSDKEILDWLDALMAQEATKNKSVSLSHVSKQDMVKESVQRFGKGRRGYGDAFGRSVGGKLPKSAGFGGIQARPSKYQTVMALSGTGGYGGMSTGSFGSAAYSPAASFSSAGTARYSGNMDIDLDNEYAGDINSFVPVVNGPYAGMGLTASQIAAINGGGSVSKSVRSSASKMPRPFTTEADIARSYHYRPGPRVGSGMVGGRDSLHWKAIYRQQSKTKKKAMGYSNAPVVRQLFQPKGLNRGIKAAHALKPGNVYAFVPGYVRGPTHKKAYSTQLGPVPEHDEAPTIVRPHFTQYNPNELAAARARGNGLAAMKAGVVKNIKKRELYRLGKL